MRHPVDRLSNSEAAERAASADRVEASRAALLPGDLAAHLKQEHRDVVVIGSLSIVHALMAQDLIDEYRLLTFPTALGEGARLFPAGNPVYLDCVSAEQAGAAVLARYVRSGEGPRG